MPDDGTAKMAEQARSFLTWAEQEIHDEVFLPGALRELKERVARILYALAQQAADHPADWGERAARLWRFFSVVDPRQQTVGHRQFVESFQNGEPTERTLRDLWHASYLSVGPPKTVDSASWKVAVERGFAGRAAVAELMQAIRGLAASGGGDRSPRVPTASPRPFVNDDSHVSPTKLAAIFGVPADPLRTRLRRWRAQNHTGWIENTERGPREAKYLYRVGAVRDILTRRKRPAKRPACDQRKKTDSVTAHT